MNHGVFVAVMILSWTIGSGVVCAAEPHGEHLRHSQNRLTPTITTKCETFSTSSPIASTRNHSTMSLTAATTIGGPLPLAMSGGPLWEAMSWCKICGLIVATLLTLLVVPALHALFVETFGVQPVRVEST